MRYQIVLQHSEEDCGAACLATVAKHYGRTFAIIRVREAVGTGSRGTSLLGLRRGAEALGFNARQVKASPQLLDQLHKAPLPAIIHSLERLQLTKEGNREQARGNSDSSLRSGSDVRSVSSLRVYERRNFPVPSSCWNPPFGESLAPTTTKRTVSGGVKIPTLYLPVKEFPVPF